MGLVEGVWRTRVGYAGGDRDSPTYQSVGDHSECVQVDFDPTVISYEELVDLVFTLYDPTGSPGYSQYASLVLAHDGEQLAIARERAEVAAASHGKPLTTRVEPLKKFWLAEEYHQKYYLKSDETLMAQFEAMSGSAEAALRDSTAAMRVNGYLYGKGAPAQLEDEIDSFGLGEGAREHLASIVSEAPGGAGCAVP